MAVILDEFKHFIQWPEGNTSRDDEMREVLDAAIENIDSKVWPSVTGEPVTFRAKPTGRGVLVLPATHLPDDVVVTDPTGTLVPAARVDVDHDAGLVTVPDTGASGWWRVTVTPDDEITASLRQAVKIMAKHLWGTQRGAGRTVGAGAEFDTQDAPALAGFAVPRRAAELMQPYAKIGGFA